MNYERRVLIYLCSLHLPTGVTMADTQSLPWSRAVNNEDS